MAWSYPGTARLNLVQTLKAAIGYVVSFLTHSQTPNRVNATLID